tara:strand:+ start:262 stop:483 length:222 start_codon:yes stop_codon:yes gene_type:complete
MKKEIYPKYITKVSTKQKYSTSWLEIIDKKIELIEELKKEVKELKEENENLNWMLKKQFDNSFEQIKNKLTKN